MLACDIAAARYMGLDPEKINYLKYFLEHDISLDEIKIFLDGEETKNFFTSESKYLDFITIPQWECVKIS